MRLFSFFMDVTAIQEPRTKSAEKAVPVWRRPGVILAVVIILAMLMGLNLTPQFGQSVDEPARIRYAALSLQAYSGKLENPHVLADEKGAFYVMAAYIGANIFQTLIPGWKFIDGWHYMSFLTFLMSVFFFFRLCRRLIRPGPALAATLMFGSQPLLLGQAFMNPKDIPFMAFFLGSVTLGLEMVDHQLSQKVTPQAAISFRRWLAAFPGQAAGIWKSVSHRRRRLWIGLVLALVVLGISYIPIHLGLAWLIDQAYHADPSSGLGQLFQRIAQHNGQIPVEAYIAKVQTLHAWLSGWVAAGLGIALFWSLISIFALQPGIWMAGLFLGFASAIRTLGPATGLLVVVYFLVKAGRKAVPVVLEYLGIGALTTYVFWPYLWSNPIQNYLASFSEAADFPWTGDNLFGGKLYQNPILPSGYFTTLFGIQFTETALALFLVGLVLTAILLWKKKTLRLDLFLLGAWFVAPIAAALLLHSSVYTNFRQFLFVVPPLFVIAGFAWQAIWDRLQHRAILFALVTGVALLPALYWDVHLNPYQYTYYNSLVGGVTGAFNIYEGDYWLTSSKEAIEYVNQVAPPNSTVYFWEVSYTAEPYARADLKLISYLKAVQSPVIKSGYMIVSWIRVSNESIFPNSPILYQVRRDGNIFAVVKKVEPGDLLSAQ